jgi:hypothetical protein
MLVCLLLDLVGRVLLPDGVLEPADGRLHLGNLVHRLLQVGLELPGGLLGLSHPVRDGLGRPVRLLPHILAGVGQRAPDHSAQSDTRLALLNVYKFWIPFSSRLLLYVKTYVVIGERLLVLGKLLWTYSHLL